MELTQEIFEPIFSQGVFEWFNLTEGTRDGDTTAITFAEKDIPPLIDEHQNHKIVARKFHHITVTDFPLSGRPTRLTFPVPVLASRGAAGVSQARRQAGLSGNPA